MELVDSHCHLDAAEFGDDRAAVIDRARGAGVLQQVVPAIDRAGWPGIRDLCAGTAGLYPAYGLHPMFLARHRPADLERLGEWLERERPVAVGECGLDYFVPDLPYEEQHRYFMAQLHLARDTGLPVILHARRAVDPLTSALRQVGGLRGVVHSFSGSEQQARKLWDLGFMIGLGGPVTYDRAQRLHRLCASMPIEWLLLETDAPDQPDSGWRGRRNEPARLVHVLEAIARLRGESPGDIAAATTANARRLFGLPAPAATPAPRGS